jgi:uncharacterized protein YggE
MYVTQSIHRPQGVNAFGSCLIRVDPDYVSVRFAVARVAAHPKEAFEAARAAAQSVRERVRALGVPESDLRASDVTLAEAFSGPHAERRKVGYEASVPFHLILRELGKLEPLLSGVVDAGADRISSVHPKTSRIREVRKEARERAVKAARTKAEELASAAGGKLGAVLHIEDVNADEFGRRSHLPDLDLTENEERAAVVEAHNPGSISVAAAVMACFAIVTG